MADLTVVQQAMAQDFNFQKIVNATILDEGGDTITDDPKDRGGRTKYGITQKLLSAVMPGKKVDDLTQDEAEAIYFVHFWMEYKFNLLPERIGAKLFNFCVTAGPRPAFMCLQRAMRSNNLDVKDDGVMGPITRGKLTAYVEDSNYPYAQLCLMTALKSEIAGYYRDLDQERFEDGWVNRAYRG